MIMIGALVIALVVGFLGAPDTRGKTLEEIEEERYGSPTPPTRNSQDEFPVSGAFTTATPPSASTPST